MLTDGLEWCGLLVDYCDVFISSLDSNSDGTHSLQRIHWWASDVDGLRDVDGLSNISANFNFLVNFWPLSNSDGNIYQNLQKNICGPEVDKPA